MAKITDKNTGKSIKIANSKPIKEACKKLGVPFSCEEGICGSCMIDIVEGEENLSQLTQEEKDMGRDRKHRLACQCKIKKGEIKIDF